MNLSFWIRVFVLLGWMPRSSIAGSNASFILKFLINLHSGFHRDWTSFHHLPQWMRVDFSLPSYLFCFFPMGFAHCCLVFSYYFYNLSIIIDKYFYVSVGHWFVYLKRLYLLPNLTCCFLGGFYKFWLHLGNWPSVSVWHVNVLFYFIGYAYTYRFHWTTYFIFCYGYNALIESYDIGHLDCFDKCKSIKVENRKIIIC